jgi:hypothetical protein
VKHQDELWAAIRGSLHVDRWISLSELYRRVESTISLDPDDHDPDAPGSEGARWKRNVRNVLQRRKALGHVEWDGHGRYRLGGGGPAAA